LGEADLEVITQAKELAPSMRIAVLNKSDLPAVLDLHELTGILDGVEVVGASAASLGGTAALEERLAGLVLSGKAVRAGDGAMVTSVRHRDALERAMDHVREALESAGSGAPAAFVAVDLHSALNALGEITGETVGEDLLDEIFSNFCIGK
jgi:tRNA modification GTPase